MLKARSPRKRRVGVSGCTEKDGAVQRRTIDPGRMLSLQNSSQQRVYMEKVAQKMK